MKSADDVSVEQIYGDLAKVSSIIGASKDLKVLLRSPAIEYRKKQAIFQEIFKPIISAATLDFIMLLLEKKREIMFKEIIAAFKQLYNERHNIQTTHITSAAPLDNALQNQIAAAVEAKINKKIDAVFTVNPNLKGGIIITIGDITYDGSVRRQLELLYKQMTGKDMPENVRSAI